ncbi:MAG: three-Cys-motif partner protein TcmP [Planctomycetes bacterium]|nr:three-Cys-motif partner protein TcmP [Planctomycetota bacterium]
MAQVPWEEACARVRDDDGLPCREVGAWSEDKLFVWHSYIQTTSTSMVGKPQWAAGLFYVDLFGGPGVCQVKNSTRRLPGSPLIAAMAAKPFKHIFVVDSDQRNAVACEQRLAKVGAKDRATVFTGDSNKIVNEIARRIPKGALTLALVDPEGLDVDFETLRTLSSAGRVDLLILFADAYDALRNLDAFVSGDDKRLDRMLGARSDWRKRLGELPNWEPNNLREFFSRQYIETLKNELGYAAADTKIIRGPHGPLYRLVYASKHPRGLDFWQKVDARDRHGQKGLFS